MPANRLPFVQVSLTRWRAASGMLRYQIEYADDTYVVYRFPGERAPIASDAIGKALDLRSAKDVAEYDRMRERHKSS